MGSSTASNTDNPAGCSLSCCLSSHVDVINNSNNKLHGQHRWNRHLIPVQSREEAFGCDAQKKWILLWKVILVFIRNISIEKQWESYVPTKLRVLPMNRKCAVGCLPHYAAKLNKTYLLILINIVLNWTELALYWLIWIFAAYLNVCTLSNVLDEVKVWGKIQAEDFPLKGV